MEKAKKQEFVSRIAGANRTELVVIMYEMLLENTQEAKTAILKGDKAALEQEMKQARGILNHLMGSLDYEYKLSFILMRLYISADKRLAGMVGNPDMSKLEEVEEVIKKLAEDFSEIAKQDHSPVVMQNTESIYAGLTYGKNSLNESVGYGSGKRGFTV